MSLTIGSLFSGIGGLELGLERGIGEGCRTVWQVEQDEYCRAVLSKHWPTVERFDDVRTVGVHNLKPVDLICGGFPCQDVSHLGKQRGMGEGTRSGLWHEYARIIRDLRPRHVVVENVPGLLADGMGLVLSTLAGLGYDAEWDVLPACAVGAPHTRERVFILAYPRGLGMGGYRTTRSPEDSRPHRGHLVGRIAPDEQWQQWEVDRPRILRMLNGVPHQLDRNRALGNSVVPQVAEVVGRLIAERERELRSVA